MAKTYEFDLCAILDATLQDFNAGRISQAKAIEILVAEGIGEYIETGATHTETGLCIADILRQIVGTDNPAQLKSLLHVTQQTLTSSGSSTSLSTLLGTPPMAKAFQEAGFNSDQVKAAVAPVETKPSPPPAPPAPPPAPSLPKCTNNVFNLNQAQYQFIGTKSYHLSGRLNSAAQPNPFMFLNEGKLVFIDSTKLNWIICFIDTTQASILKKPLVLAEEDSIGSSTYKSIDGIKQLIGTTKIDLKQDVGFYKSMPPKKSCFIVKVSNSLYIIEQNEQLPPYATLPQSDKEVPGVIQVVAGTSAVIQSLGYDALFSVDTPLGTIICASASKSAIPTETTGPRGALLLINPNKLESKTIDLSKNTWDFQTTSGVTLLLGGLEGGQLSLRALEMQVDKSTLILASAPTAKISTSTPSILNTNGGAIYIVDPAEQKLSGKVMLLPDSSSGSYKTIPGIAQIFGCLQNGEFGSLLSWFKLGSSSKVLASAPKAQSFNPTTLQQTGAFYVVDANALLKKLDQGPIIYLSCPATTSGGHDVVPEANQFIGRLSGGDLGSLLFSQNVDSTTFIFASAPNANTYGSALQKAGAFYQVDSNYLSLPGKVTFLSELKDPADFSPITSDKYKGIDLITQYLGGFANGNLGSILSSFKVGSKTMIFAGAPNASPDGVANAGAFNIIDPSESSLAGKVITLPEKDGSGYKGVNGIAQFIGSLVKGAIGSSYFTFNSGSSNMLVVRAYNATVETYTNAGALSVINLNAQSFFGKVTPLSANPSTPISDIAQYFGTYKDQNLGYETMPFDTGKRTVLFVSSWSVSIQENSKLPNKAGTFLLIDPSKNLGKATSLPPQTSTPGIIEFRTISGTRTLTGEWILKKLKSSGLSLTSLPVLKGLTAPVAIKSMPLPKTGLNMMIAETYLRFNQLPWPDPVAMTAIIVPELLDTNLIDNGGIVNFGDDVNAQPGILKLPNCVFHAIHTEYVIVQNLSGSYTLDEPIETKNLYAIKISDHIKTGGSIDCETLYTTFKDENYAPGILQLRSDFPESYADPMANFPYESYREPAFSVTINNTDYAFMMGSPAKAQNGDVVGVLHGTPIPPCEIE